MDIKRKMYIKLYYSILDWRWCSNPNTFRVFIHLLLTANRKDQPFRGDVIRRGDVFASTQFISEATGLSIQNVKTALRNLLRTKEITKRKIGAVNVYHIENFVKWQDSVYSDDENIQPALKQQLTDSQPTLKQQLTDSQPTPNQKLTTLRYCKNEENERMRECECHAHARGKLNNVFISDEEYESFRRQYPVADKIIDELSAKIATGEPKYKTGHLGHLYVFANNYTRQKGSATPSYDIDKAMKQTLALDPTKTKRQ